MPACPSCNNNLDQDFLNSTMDELAKDKSQVFMTITESCPHCKAQLTFKKSALSYYLVNGVKEVFIGGA
ncbi:hypothetical protein [Acinetobacter baumannii]|uniref:hypothetical protein n=1 Tax=Acinetobacter baumannii TaxID=470 RepID=UPI0038915E34